MVPVTCLQTHILWCFPALRQGKDVSFEEEQIQNLSTPDGWGHNWGSRLYNPELVLSFPGKPNISLPFSTSWRAPQLLPGEPWGKCDHLTNILHLLAVPSCREAFAEGKVLPGALQAWQFQRCTFKSFTLNVSIKRCCKCLHGRKLHI